MRKQLKMICGVYKMKEATILYYDLKLKTYEDKDSDEFWHNFGKKKIGRKWKKMERSSN